MTEAEATQAVLAILRQAEVPHIVVGSLASNVYGVVRATQDSDILIAASNKQLIAIRQSLPNELEWDPQLHFETITGKTYHIVRLRGTTFQIELFDADAESFDREQLRRGTIVETSSGPQRMSSPEDVVIQKLRWHMIAKRPKDMEDAKAVIAIQREHLDWSYIKQWCEQHGSTEVLRHLCNDIGFSPDL